MKTISQRVFTLAISSVLAAGLSQAATYSYATWDSDTLSSGNTAGTVSGTISIGGNTINVTYSGDVNSGTQVGSGATNYWVPGATYTGGAVGTSPTNGTVIALAEQGTFTNTITFSSAVVNPVIDLLSLGSTQTTVSYTFNATPTLVASGSGYWGGSSNTISLNGDTVTGKEGNGAVEFVGSFTSISFTTTGAEYWNGITVGAPVPAGVAPEPSSLLLGLGALGAILPFARRRKA